MNTNFPSESLVQQNNLHDTTAQRQSEWALRSERWCRLEQRIGSSAVFMVVVFASALAAAADGPTGELTLGPRDPASGQPESTATPRTQIAQANSGSFVLTGDEDPIASEANSIWQGAVGEGFRAGVQTFSVEPGVALGVQAFGGQQVHDLAMLSLSYGQMLSGVVGSNHWYRGNWEGRLELFAGGQFSPESDPFVGLTPHVRYNFATGTRWIPFADIGTGVTASGVGPPDQSGTFEFNLQANVGTHWFVRDNVALTFEAGFLHMSCAGLHDPNLGVNTVKGMLGMTWFF
jgi:hypothetical protein